MGFKDPTPIDRYPKCNSAIDPTMKMCNRYWLRRKRKGKNKK